MNDSEFQSILDQLAAYLATKKNFIENPFRITEIKKATALASQLFPDAKIYIEDDPLQMGAMILCIEDFDLSVTEIKAFSELIEHANNFEIYAIDSETVKIAVLFQQALVRV